MGTPFNKEQFKTQLHAMSNLGIFINVAYGTDISQVSKMIAQINRSNGKYEPLDILTEYNIPADRFTLEALREYNLKMFGGGQSK